MKPPSSALGNAIRAANHERTKQTYNHSGKLGNEETSLPVSTLDQNAFVNLSIRVRKHDRIHWLIEAKRQGTSLRQVIEDSLNMRFGNTGGRTGELL